MNTQKTADRLKQAVAMLSQPVATNQHFDGRDYKYAYEVLRSDVESARAILNVEIGKLETPACKWQVGGKGGRKFPTLGDAIAWEYTLRAKDGIFRNVGIVKR
jgi:hypothetical protein